MLGDRGEVSTPDAMLVQNTHDWAGACSHTLASPAPMMLQAV